MNALIDTHAHLDFPQFSADLEKVLERALSSGVEAIVNTGTDERSSLRSVELSRRYPRISATVGVHPHGAAGVSTGWLKKLEKMAGEKTVLAIGETGLDFYRDLSPRHVQEKVFREQIRLACRVQKPLVIHSRNAHDSTLRVLHEEKLPRPAGIMHCFSGNLQTARAFLDLGFYISLAGPVTYPRSHGLRDLLKYIPAERLLLETDAPYLAPQAYRGKRNEPAYVRYVYERVALALGWELEQLARQVYVNAVRLFSDDLVDRA